MTQTESFGIQPEAAKALAEWKSVFSERVTLEAKKIAQNNNSSGPITLDHYREAAVIAVQNLSAVVQDAGSNDDRQEAA